MNSLTRYHAADLPQLMEQITKNSIGLDNYFENFFTGQQQQNYPPYNLININNVESRLEIALAGFKTSEVKVYTEYGKLVVEGKKEEKDESDYAHRGVAQRNFTRSWTLSDETEVRKVSFEDGLLTVDLGKVVPDHHARKDFL
jgi:HSP20 family molecular chaperone IbpA|tara:strand:+ start:2041 stop:2469 length:429 start_codon:yes stop_codon:yes gene_type:complete